MMGPRKLQDIRDQLQQILADAGNGDPIAWLEQCMAFSQRSRTAEKVQGEVLESLRRVVEANKPKKRRSPRATAKWPA